MGVFDKKSKETRRKDPKHIRLMRLGLWKLAKRFRLRERIGKANQWCEQHKGRTASFTMGALLISLAAGVLTSLLEGDEEHEPRFDSIAIVSPMFNGMRRIQENKNYEVMVMIMYNGEMAIQAAKKAAKEELKKKGDKLAEELDELLGF